ncbi:hypothetical protein FVE85_6236 [Porphyridium purpureum]|uniref:Uncharacterized protein n=1 Tax=Porphyridium purpureum TaxID=35688 RepID=A0A5J4Z472_PORPP|nr:hypothetical protein FVE85_6236 [Porphyridium purpureum]|eukprot:POR1995..scf295_1
MSSSEYETDTDVEVEETALNYERQLSDPSDDESGVDSGAASSKSEPKGLKKFLSKNSEGGIVRQLSKSLSKSNMGRSLSRTFSRQQFWGDEDEEMQASMASSSEAFKQIRSRKAHTYSAPALLMAPYGSGHPALDMFALFHNGIRQELEYIFYILSAMERMFTDLSYGVIEDWYSFFEVSWGYIVDYLAAERTALFPTLEKRIEIKHPDLISSQRNQKAARLAEFLNRMNKKVKETYINMPAPEALWDLRYEMNKGVSFLLTYIMTEEKVLVPDIESAFKPKEIVQIERATFQEMLAKSPNAYAVPNITFRWIKDPVIYAEIVNRHYPRQQKLKLPKDLKKFEQTHVKLLKMINHESKESVIHANQSAGFGEQVPQFYLDEAQRRVEQVGDGEEEYEDYE